MEGSCKSADDALAFFDALVRSETRLYNAVHEAVRDRHGLAASQYAFLQFVDEHPRARVVDLAQAFAVGVGAVSKGVDRLVTSGWLTRLENPEDRRSSLLVLSDEGRAVVDSASSAVASTVSDLILQAGVADELHAVTTALNRLREHLEQQRLGTPAG